MADASVTYLAFDVESVADGDLVSRIRYPGQGLDARAAVERYRGELQEKYESDFIPYTFQIPVSVAVAKITSDYRLLDISVLDEPQFRPHVLAEQRLGKVSPADAGELQRPHVRSAVVGIGRLSLRHRRAGLVQRHGQKF
jgi:hypothetical protein